MIKNTKIILLTSIIVALIVPLVSMQVTDAQIKEKESAYIQVLKQHKSLQNQNPSEQAEHIEAIKKSMRDASPFNKKINEELEILSSIVLSIQDGESRNEDVTSLYQQFYTKIFELEQYGVVNEERFLQNPKYWMERAYEAWSKINNDKSIPVSRTSFDSRTIHYVHTDDVSLKNQAQIDYICFTWPTNIYCPVIDVKWGGGSNADTSKYLYIGGTVYMSGKITLHNDGGHDAVYFGFDTKHYVKRDKNTVYSEMNECPRCYLLNEWGALHFTEGFNALPGFRAYAESHLHETITVSG